MKRLLSILVLLLVLMSIPLIVYAAPPADNGTVEATATPATADTGATPTGTTDDLAKALGTLVVYSAIIAALAAGTEVITDLLRPFFGLERQPQVMETFEQMKEWLPQTLKEMGADPKAQAQLQGYLNDLDSTVEQFKTYTSGEKIAEIVQKWALGAIKSGSAQLNAKLKELETTLASELELNSTQIAAVKDQVQKRAEAIFAALEGSEEMLQKLRDLFTQLNLQPGQVESAVGKALELMNTVVEDEKLKQELKTLLTSFGVPPSKLDQAVEDVRELLKSLKGAPGVQGVIKLASNLDSFESLLDEVERQRGEAIGSLRRLWRALRDWKGFGLTRLIPVTRENQAKIQELNTKKANGQHIWFEGIQRWWFGPDRWKEVRGRSLLGVLLYYPEQGWNWLRDNLFASLEDKKSLSTLLTPENAAKAIQALDRQHYLTEARRQRLLRFTTVFIGIALAITLRIDSLQLFQPIMGDNLPDVLYEVCRDESGELVSASFLTLEQIQNKLFVADGEQVSCPRPGAEGEEGQDAKSA
ncbi:MAG: hypothetical protein ACK2U9_24970, partial [Anaerolineae bacterium]